MACEGDGLHPDMHTEKSIEVRALNVIMPNNLFDARIEHELYVREIQVGFSFCS